LTGWEKAADSPGYASFWNSNGCENDVPISRFKSYTLVVNVTGVAPHSPKLVVVPVLKGGGIELP
jgi:hypothetical protein